MMNHHEHGETAHELLSLWHVFVALFELRHRIKGLPDVFENIKLVNVYQAPGDDDGDDWESHLKDQEQAWIITFLHYLKDGSRVIRKASGGGRWDGRNCQHKTHGKTSWHERKYNLVERTNEQQIANKFTMFEYSPDEDKPKYALCRITTDKRNNAYDRPLSSSQQPEGKEIDHSNKGHKDETHLYHEKSGHFQNTTADYNQQILERKLRELRKHHTYADIRKVLDQIESEKLPAATPKEHSTEAPVSNTRKCDRCSCTNTMEAGTSTQGQEQVKVEMLESNSYQGGTTNLHDDTYRNCIEFGKQSSHHGNCNEKNAEQGSYPINLVDFPGSCTFQELCNSDDDEMAEQNAVVLEPNQLSHNFNANSTVAMMVELNAHFQEPKLYHNINGNSTEPVLNNINHLLSWNRNISALGPSTSNCAAFMGGPDEPEFEQNVQDPYNFHANLTEPTENSWYLPFYYAPTVPSITDQGTYNAIEEHQFALCNTQHGQIFESDAYLLEPNNSSYYFKTISTEPTEKGNHLPIYNQNTIAPGLDTNNNGTTEPEDMDWINIMDLSD